MSTLEVDMEDLYFNDIEKELTGLASQGIVPGLDRLFTLLPRLGNPQNAFPAVHVAGTNGKGSTCAALAAILTEAGYKTAVYTSPHLVSFGERLRIDGKNVPARKWSDAVKKIKTALNSRPELFGNRPTYFELITAAAFVIIADSGADISIIETGLGGRLDATNTLGNVVLTLITPIGVDHAEYLGSDLRMIANEKFAIMRRDTPAVFASEGGALLESRFREAAGENGAIGILLRETCSLRGVKFSLDGTKFIYERDFALRLRTPLVGLHQAENTALAVSGAYQLVSRYPKIMNDVIVSGVAKTLWPGRFETIRENPLVIVDGAHNPHAMKRLVEVLSSVAPYGSLNIVVAMMKDKDVTGALALLKPLKPVLYCTMVPDMERCITAVELKALAEGLGLETAAGAYENPLHALKASVLSDKTSICCGSLYLVGYIKGYIDEITRI